MLSINTNLSSQIVQSSLKQSTNSLNTAIERMTTGAKINHAKDNAANYSIATNMSSKISAYQVAEDNCAMGLDLVTTASDIIATMQDHASRLQSLSIQARNGTYGASSLSAITSEASAIMAEITRLYTTAEYNSVSILNRSAYTIASHFATAGTTSDLNTDLKAKYNGFIDDPVTYTDAEVAAMTKVADVDSYSSGQTYSISTKEELVKLANYVNSGNNTTGVTFVLANDIDLSPISNWQDAIGTSANSFDGTFDGNGHVLKNFTWNHPSLNFGGLFGCVNGDSVIKNVGLENCNVVGNDTVGGLVGYTDGEITNCYVTGNVSGRNGVGGLVGQTCLDLSNCYAIGKVNGNNCVGGLIGETDSKVSNCFASVEVEGINSTGGLIGITEGLITDCYATGNVIGDDSDIGGLVGETNSSIINCFATGDVSNAFNRVGGLAGFVGGFITNCYSTGNVKASNSNAGGLAGYVIGSVTNSYATGNVTGFSSVGGLVGNVEDEVSNCYATGNVNGNDTVGGLVGMSDSIINSYATGSVHGAYYVGGLVGDFNLAGGDLNISNCTSYSTVSGVDVNSTGSLIGAMFNTGTATISGCESIKQNMSSIGGVYDEYDILIADYDMTDLLAGISDVATVATSTTLQVGINSDDSCQLSFDTNFTFDISAITADIASDAALNQITDFMNLLSEKQTQLGSVQNRLESALDQISVSYDNLVSSLSTIQDADIGEVSSEYIRQQILQQASATLMATANQSPSIALQLL